MDVGSLLAIHTSPLELALRGSLMYWFLLLVFRFVLRRDAGALGVADILFVVIVADASQNAMSGGYDTVAEGFILVGTLVLWNYLLDWASFQWKPIRYLTDPEPVLLVDRGRLLARNLRREFLTRGELDAQLRQHGIDDVSQVRKAYLENDGKLSVLTFDKRAEKPPEQGKLPGAG